MTETIYISVLLDNGDFYQIFSFETNEKETALAEISTMIYENDKFYMCLENEAIIIKDLKNKTIYLGVK